MFKPNLLALATGSLLISTTVVANEQDAEDVIIVTGTRTASTMDQSLVSVSMIDRSMIERTQATDVLELLTKYAGVQISQNGGLGAASSAFLRGTNGDHTLILVDGVRVSSATLGTAALQHIDPSQIERIEVVKGTRSSIYGSDAIGGVIQIFTKKGSGVDADSSSQVSLGYGLGSFGTTDAKVGGQFVAGGVTGYFGLNQTKSDGFSRLDIEGPATNLDPDDDGYENTSINGSLNWKILPSMSLNLGYFSNQGETEYDAGPWGAADSLPYSEFEVNSISSKFEWDITDGFSWVSNFSQSEDKSESLDENSPAFLQFNTERQQIGTSVISRFRDNDGTETQFVLGLDQIDESVNSTTVFAEDSRSTTGVYSEIATYFVDLLDLNLGFRQDDSDAYGNQSSFHFSSGFRLADEYTLVASYGTGFKAPTFNDLYYPADPFAQGNPDIKPEDSQNIDLELRGQYSNLGWKLAAYRNEINNLIDWAPDENFVFQPQNLNEVLIKGAEFQLDGTVFDVNVQAAVNWTEPTDLESGNLLPRRAFLSSQLNLNRDFGLPEQFGVINVGLNASAFGDRYNDAANTQSLGGYVMLDLNLAYAVTNDLDVRLALKNITDRDYQLAQGFNTQGTSFMLSSEIRF